MNRAARAILLATIALTLSACGGGGGGSDEDIMSSDQFTDQVEPAVNCEGRDGLPCDDGDPCHVGEGICLAGECYYEDAQIISCDTPPNQCSSEGQCDGEGGCTWELAPGYCLIDDACVAEGTTDPDNQCAQCKPAENRGSYSPVSGSACVPEDTECAAAGQCQEGFCVPVLDQVECASDSDCLGKDDGDACNGVFICQDCVCVFDESTIVLCDDSEETECAKAVCVPASGECELQPVGDGTTCDDGDPCTSNDYCVGGECQSGESSPPVWQPAKAANTAYLTAIRFQSGNPSTIYAVGSGGVVYRSGNGGQTFEQSDILAPGGDLGDWLHVTGQGTVSILALFGGSLQVSNNGGLNYGERLSGCEALAEAVTAPGTFVAICNKQTYRSQDSGATWSVVGSVPGSGAPVSALAAKDGSTYYLGTRDQDGAGRGYIYRSTDGAASWSQIDPPDRPDLAQVSHRGIFISTTAPDRVFLGYTHPDGALFEFGQVPLFRSDDGGASFAPLNANMQGASWVPLALDTIGRLVLGVDSALSRGGNFGTGPWGAIPKPNLPGNILFHDIHSATIQPGDDFTFFVPVGNGLAKASQLGVQWTLYSEGLDGGLFARLTRCTESGKLYAVERYSSGLYSSTDGGINWSPVALPEEASGLQFTELVCSPANGNSVHAYTANGGQVFTNNGQTWSTLDESNGPVLASHNAMTSFPGTPQTIIVSRLGMGLFSTTDGGIPQGNGYEALPLGEAYVASVVADPNENGRVYVGTYATPDSNRARVYTCSNFGESCSLELESPVVPMDGPETAYWLTIDPGMPGRVYAGLTGTTARVEYSNDYGNSWQQMASLPMLTMRGHNEILPDPEVKGSAYAAFWLHGVYHFDALSGEWALLEEAPEAVTSLAFEPGEGGALLAGSGQEAKLYASEDGGATWALYKDFGLTNYHVQSLSVEKGQMVAVLQGRSHNEAKLFVHNGAQWLEGIVGTAVSAAAVVEPENETVLAAGRFGGLYLSEDGGQSFVQYGELGGAAVDLLVMPNDSSVMLAAMDCGTLPAWYDANQTSLGSDCGVKRSVDGGLTWFTVLNTGKRCTSIAISPDNNNVLVTTCPGAGTYFSLDGGSSWSTLSGWTYLDQGATAAIGQGMVFVGAHAYGMTRGEIAPDGLSIGNFNGSFSDPVKNLRPVSAVRVAVQPNNPSRVVVYAQPGGLLRTDDFGSSWWYAGERIAAEPGSTGTSASRAAFVPRWVSTPDGWALWVAAAGRGIYRSLDNGVHWVFASANSLPVSTAHPVALLFDPDFANYVWLAAQEGFYRTSDLGGQWQEVTTGLPNGAIEAVLPPNNNSLYVSVAGAGIYSVPFDGAAWTKMHAVDFYGLDASSWGGRLLSLWQFALPDLSADKTLLVGVDPYGLFKTQDGGISYMQTGEGLPAGPVHGLARSPHDAQFVVAGTPYGPYGSYDGGETFQPLAENQQLGSCYSFAFDAEEALVLYALCTDYLPHGEAAGVETEYGTRTLYISLDEGLSWESAGDGLQSNKLPVQVLADPDMGGVLYIATLEGGVLRSLDGGQTVTPWSTGLPAPYTGGRGRLHAAPLSFSPDGTELVIGTEGFGFYRRILNAICE